MTTRQQPWNEYEAVLLLEGFLAIEKNEENRANVVKRLSYDLRKMALCRGTEIDEFYRNENGISFQLRSMESAYCGYTVFKPSTKLFDEIVNIYRNSKDEYDRLLCEAKTMTKDERTREYNVQEKFFAWLTARVSSSQLSEFYIACKDIETFCISKRILTQPLFETTDTVVVQRVIDTIKSNRIFQFKYFRQLGKMRKVMDHYMTFLREVSLQQTKETEIVPVSDKGNETISKEHIESQCTIPSDKTPEIQTVQHDETPVSVIDDEIILTENRTGAMEVVAADQAIMPEDSNTKTIIWNFSNNNVDFANANPTTISYFGDEEKVVDWEDAFVKIICAMQEDYPSIIRGMVGCRFAGVGKVLLTGIAGLSRFSKPVELNDGLYLEIDCSPDEIVSTVRILMDKCNMDYENIEISYKTSGEIEVNTVSKSEDGTIISEDFSAAGIQDYIVQVLGELNVPYVDHRNNNGCLWIIGDRRLRPVFDRFIQYSAVFHYKEDGGRATKGEPAWWTKDVIISSDEPTEDGSSEQPVKANQNSHDSKLVINSAIEGKAAFENWLITGAGLAARSAQSYTSAINVAGQYAVELGISENELLFILDANQVYQISMKLLANPKFAQMNESQHNRYHAALSKYWDYCKAISSGDTVSVPLKAISKQEDEIKKNRGAFISWAQSQQMQTAAVLAYLSDIKKCTEFAREYAYITEEHILLIEDANELERVLFEMQKDSRFAELNNGRHKRPVSAMNKLIAFRKATAKSETRSPVVSPMSTVPTETPAKRAIATISTPIIDPQVKERHTAILAKNFEDGFRPAKAIDRNRFRMYYSDMFGEELVEDDECLVRTLMKVGTLRDERIFVKDETEQKDLLEEINDTITETFKDGASCIYLDCLFARFQEQLAEMLHIYNVDSLENVLFSSGKRNYFKRYNYLYGYNKEPAPTRDVIEYMKKSHLPVTYLEIENDLWYIPLDKIKNTLVTTPSIVNVASEAYLHAPNLPVSESEVQQIMELINHALLQRNYISDVELMQLIEEHCPSVLMNTPNYPVWGLRNALAYLLRDRFSFRGAIISDKNEEISMAEVFSDFCQHSEHITVDELKQFANELNTVIYWDSVYSEMVRVNANEFVRRDQIHFDIAQTDSVLDSLIQNAYTPIKTINLFLHFPAIEIPWNNFVLESYVAQYSKRFRLLHASYTATDCCGAMVRQDSGITDYRTLIVDVLAKNTGWKSKKDALQLLVDLGYQQRRSYSDIEKVMQEAKAKMQSLKK